MRGTISTLPAATLLTLAIGLQVLEATGSWDLTFQDTGDEAVIVVAVLCIGAALVMARGIRPHIPLAAIDEPLVLRLAIRLGVAAPPVAWSSSSTSPPLSLRI